MLMAALRKRWRILLGMGLGVVLIAAGTAAYLMTRGGDVSDPNVEFRAEPTQTPAPDQPADPKEADRFRWPIYGYTKDRRRYLAAPATLRPPYHRVWSLTGRVLLEFPPVLDGRRLFLMKNNGALYAASKATGRVLWKRKLGHLAAASPAVSEGRVFAVVLERGKGIRAGRIVALRQSDGRILWNRPLASRSESSPVIDGDRIYFGSENGTVYSIRASDGAVRWKVKVSGAVKSGLALADGKLYFGDYSGRVYAIRQADGSRAWTASTHGSRFGLGSGNFYSTPAVAYGRVYIGSTDGNVYSFASSDGKLAWRKGTGGYVYGSPAVAQVPGGKPTVYIGSYSRRFYALDARSGGVIWSIHSGGRVSGGATVIGDIVYFSELDGKRTVGVGARTGRHVFEFGRGAYNPVVSDGRWIFLTGYSSLYALRPLSAEGKQTMAKRAKAARRTKVEARRAAQRREADVRSTCRARAARLHDRHGARIRSFRRCVPSLRHFRTRRACVRRAEATHERRSEIVRSARRCVRRNS